MKRVLSLIVLVMLSLFCAACARPQGYIDFTQPQDTHPAAEEPDTKPLRIAFASVMSPKETRQVYQQIVNYISQQENRPAILIQRRTYEELNTLLANGDADVAFSSTGAYAAYQGHEPIELLAMTETNGSSYYQTYIITAADSDITDKHQLQGRVGHHLVEHLHGAVPQAGAYPLQQAGLGQEGVGNHHHPPPGQPLQGRQGVRSKENCGLELKSFHRASPVSSLMGLVWQTRRKLYGSLFFAFLHKKFTGFSSDLTFTTGVLRYIIDPKNI